MKGRRWIDIEVQKSEDQSCYQMSKFITNLLRHREVGRDEDPGVPYDKIIEKCIEKLWIVFKILAKRSKTRIEDGTALVSAEVDGCSGKRWWSKEKVSILFETKWTEKTPVPSSHSRSFRKSSFWKCSCRSCIAIQCTSADEFHQVCFGHGNELRSIVRNGLTPGGFSTKIGRYAVFFTVVDPIDDKRGWRETFCDLSQARIAPCKNTWIHLQNTVYWCNVLPAQERGRRFYQTRSHAVVLCATLPAELIEKAVCMKTGEQRYQKESERHVLRSKQIRNVNHKIYQVKKQDHLGKHKNEVRSFRETRCNIVDYWIPGISLNGSRAGRTKTTVAKLIEKFESHKYKEQFLQDVSQTQKINRFSEASQRLLKDMNQTEIFELCENSFCARTANPSQKLGSFIADAEEIWKYNRSPKPNLECISIDGFIIRKTCSRGPQHGPPERKEKFFKANDMLRKATNRGFPTWQEQENYRSSLKDHDFGEQEVTIYDRLAFERHDCTATEAGRMRYSQNWVLTLNAEGKQPPWQLRPDYEEAKRECQRQQPEFMAAKGQLFTPIHASKQRRRNPNQQFQGSEE